MKKFFGISVMMILLLVPILANAQQDKAEFPGWLNEDLKEELCYWTGGISEETAIKLLSEKIDYLEACRENIFLKRLLYFRDVEITRLYIHMKGYAILRLTRDGISAYLQYDEHGYDIGPKVDSLKTFLPKRPQVLMSQRWFRKLVFLKIIPLTKEKIWAAIAKSYGISRSKK